MLGVVAEAEGLGEEAPGAEDDLLVGDALGGSVGGVVEGGEDLIGSARVPSQRLLPLYGLDVLIDYAHPAPQNAFKLVQ